MRHAPLPARPRNAYLKEEYTGERTVNTRSALARIIAAVRGAYALSAALEAGRRPQPRHLAALGIDAAEFGKIDR
jgi:hypothetical protein